MRDDSADRSYKAQRVTLIGAVLDVALGVAKVTIGVFAHSHALIVDGIHSFSDVVTDAMVLLIARFSYKAPDREHP